MSLLHRHFSLFLALRYLRPKRTFLSIITFFSILGVTLGVMVLIVVLSVMTGFERELEEKVVGFDAHIVIRNPDGMNDWVAIQKKAEAIPDVVAASPFVMGPVLVEFNRNRLAPKIRAIDPDLEQKVTDIKKFIVDGTFDLDGDKTVIGSELAQMLGVHVGEKIALYSPGKIDQMMDDLARLEKNGDKASASALKQMILPKELEVTGIFESGRYLYDSDILLVPLFIGQEVYDKGGSVDGLSVKTTDRYLANEIRDKLNETLPPPVEALTWIDQNKQLFDAISMERNVMFFLLLFIIVVAAFGIMNTLITVTVQKTREIGVMKALGAQTFQIIGVFLSQGIVVGIFGTLTGLLAGIELVKYRNEASHFLATVLGVEIFPRSVYQFNEIPAQVVPQDVAIICVSAFVICALAALIPAWFAARLDPVKALRYE